MDLSIVTPEYDPYLNITGTGQDAASLADAFVAEGHSVTVVMPLPSGVNLDSFSLARRLVPITVSVDGRPKKAIRYDGRTSSGVQVHLLEFEDYSEASSKGDWPEARVEAFGKAAGELLTSLTNSPCACISFGIPASCVPAVVKGKEGETCATQVWVLNDVTATAQMLERGIAAADRIILFDAATEDLLRSSGLNIDEMLEERRAVQLKRPSADCAVSPCDKKSEKARWQLENGLPVRPDVPLVGFPASDALPYLETIESLVRRDLQVIAEKTDGVAPLLEKYRDRLALVSRDELFDSVVCAADAFVAGDDESAALSAMAWGTLPIVGPETAASFVEIEPSLLSGSAITIRQVSPEGVEEAFGRLQGAFARGDDFFALLGRLPGFVTTWETTARHYLQVIESV